MLKVIKVNFNIGSNKVARRKIESCMIQQDLKTLQKLLRIFTFVTLINLSL